MICLVKVGLFNGLRLAAKGDVFVQTLTHAIALVNVIDAAEHFWESKLENPEGVLIFNSDYFTNENPAARGEDIAF